jgi:hypothetical protein
LPDWDSILVVNKYQWILDPRFGRFTVHVDGERAGIAPLSGWLNVPVAPGSHEVQVGLWGWLRSKPLAVDVHPGSTVRIEADIPRSVAVDRRILRAYLRPKSFLELRQLKGLR